MKSPKQLYFIAIVPPDPIFLEVTEMKRYMAEKYFSDAALRSPAHITLHMPFEWKSEKEDRLFNVLNDFSLEQTALNLSLNGFGCFEPRVIYVNVEPNETLKKMQADLMTEAKTKLNLFNANYRKFPFHPHITIAFRNLKKTVFPQAWEEFKAKKYQANFLVNSICLLKHNGKFWDIHKEFKFSGS